MSEDAIPPEIHRLARTYRLGEPIARYETLPRVIKRYRFSLYMTILMIWLGLFALLSTVLIFQRAFAGDIPQIDLRLVFGWLIFWIVVLWLIMRNEIRTTEQKTSLYLFKLGLLGYNEQEKSVEVIAWDEIESVWLHILYIYERASEEEEGKIRYDWRYTFQRVDGEKYIFRGHFGIKALSYYVDKEVTARLLPRAIATYEAGQPVCFGNIQVSQKGMQIGQEAIAWPNIFSVELEGYQIIVRLSDWEHWIGTPKDETPNVCVLEALIRHIIAKDDGKEISEVK